MPPSDTPRSWLSEMRRGLYGLVVGAIPIAITRSESGFRYAGGVLLILGGIAVLRGFLDLRRDFGIPPMRSEIRIEAGSLQKRWLAWLRHLLHLRGTPITVNAASAQIIFGVGDVTARVTQGFDNTLSVDRRLAVLEKRYQELETNHGRTEDRLVAMIRAVEAGLVSEQSAREVARTSVLERMEVVMTGGLRFQIIGIAWLFIGTVLTTTAPELARWFCG